jgi:phosphatidylinositol-4,5-bisphosphate 3-kinase
MKNRRHTLRFGFLLEAYCRGIGPNLKNILKQLDAINLLSSISISYKSSRDNPFQNRVISSFFFVC